MKVQKYHGMENAVSRGFGRIGEPSPVSGADSPTLRVMRE
jgi:hypothetical protein